MTNNGYGNFLFMFRRFASVLFKDDIFQPLCSLIFPEFIFHAMFVAPEYMVIFLCILIACSRVTDGYLSWCLLLLVSVTHSTSNESNADVEVSSVEEENGIHEYWYLLFSLKEIQQFSFKKI